MGFGLYIPIRAYPRGGPLGWFLSGAFLVLHCVFLQRLAQKFHGRCFFFNGREIFVHKKGAFFSRPFFFIFHGNDGSGSSIFFSFP